MFNFFRSKPKNPSIIFPLGARENDPDVRDIAFNDVHPLTGVELFEEEYRTDISMLGEFYQILGTCVAHAFGFMKMFYDYLETGKVVRYSVRFFYALARRFAKFINNDDPANQGLQPRSAAKVLATIGISKESALDNESIPHGAYVNDFVATPEMLKEANEARSGGFAFPEISVMGLKHAIKISKIIPVTVAIDWNKLDPDGTLHAPSKIIGTHEIDLIGWDKQGGGRFIAKNWWRGYEFLYIPFTEVKQVICDAIAFTDIPNDLLKRAKETPYLFLTDLKIGMMGEAVMQLQKRLMDYGLLDITAPTSYFGALTLTAVMDYQGMKRLPITGYVGKLTRESLNADAGHTTPKLLAAVIQVESGGNDKAEGDLGISEKDGGHAYGCLQIRQGVVDTVNKLLNTKYRSRDCLGNRALSLLIWNNYWKAYPNLDTDEKKAKAWNGGAAWQMYYGKPLYKNYTKKLDAYWSAVKALM